MGTIRNRVKKFLIEEGITDLSEMDAALRMRYEAYLNRNETIHAPITCLRAFDKIFIHRMKEETADAGSAEKIYYRVSVISGCGLTHYPDDGELRNPFWRVKTGRNWCGILLWGVRES